MKPLLLLLALLAACESRPKGTLTGTAPADSGTYYTRRTPSYGGTGKVYLGREIAEVMGHLGAGWLERPEREQEERTDLLLDALGLKPTDVAADIGAGTGYFTFRMAERVPQGRVLAVDIQPEMIGYLRDGQRQRGLRNVEPILSTITEPKLPPASVDLVLFVDAYHEFSHPREMMEAIVRALRPGGRVALVEYRLEDPDVPIKRLHKMSAQQARKEMAAVGLKLLRADERLPQQHILFFGL
jgi:SAM-dependent methyltransferase